MKCLWRSLYISAIVVAATAFPFSFGYSADDPTAVQEFSPVQANTAPAVPAALPGPGMPWPHEGSDIPADPAVHWGRLANGFRFAIVPHQKSPRHASLRLCIDAGSLSEKDGQEGWAHFIEHMAFNGTRHFAGTGAIEFFQRQGMSFGAHTNAETSFHRTVYKLELPNTDRVQLDKTLEWYRDIMDGLTFDPAEVERERGVVLSEWDVTNTGNYRRTLELLNFIYPNATLSKRLPIGLQASIARATAEQLNEFYQSIYRPDNSVLVIAGDIDPQAVEELIRHHFDSLTLNDIGKSTSASDLAKAIRDQNRIEMDTEDTCQLFFDRELTQNLVTVQVSRQVTERVDSVARQRKELSLVLATIMLSKRLQGLVDDEGSPVLGCAASVEESYRLFDELNITAAVRPKLVMEASGLVEKEVRRCLMHGFEDDEFNAVLGLVETILESAEQGGETRENSEIADSLVDNLSDNTVFTSPSQDSQLFKKMKLEVTKEDCRTELSEFWNSDGKRIFVSGPSLDAFEFPSFTSGVKALLSTFTPTAENDDLTRRQSARPQFAYTTFGQQGTVIQRQHHEDLEVTQICFENNARLNIKPTTFEKGSVGVLVRFGRGTMSAPRSQPGLAELANVFVTSGGLGKHSLTQLNEILTDRNIAISFSAKENCFQFVGSGTSKELPMVLQIITAYLTDPAFSPAAWDRLQSGLDGYYATLEHTAGGMEARELSRFLRGGDPRFGFPALDEIKRLTADDVKNWLSDPFQRSYLEVTIVGDVAAEAAVEAVAATIGTLPKRDAAMTKGADEPLVVLPGPEQSRSWQFTSDSPVGRAYIVWKTEVGEDIHQSRRTDLVAEILQERLRQQVREEMGAVYAPAAVAFPSTQFDNYSFVAGLIQANAQNITNLSQIVADIGQKFGRDEITEDEFERTFKPYLETLEEGMLKNPYWLNALSESQEDPRNLDYARTRLAENRSITKEEVQELAHRIFADATPLILSLIPEPPQ